MKHCFIQSCNEILTFALLFCAKSFHQHKGGNCTVDVKYEHCALLPQWFRWAPPSYTNILSILCSHWSKPDLLQNDSCLKGWTNHRVGIQRVLCNIHITVFHCISHPNLIKNIVWYNNVNGWWEHHPRSRWTLVIIIDGNMMPLMCLTPHHCDETMH